MRVAVKGFVHHREDALHHQAEKHGEQYQQQSVVDVRSKP
jgi:hypothetical protein